MIGSLVFSCLCLFAKSGWYSQNLEGWYYFQENDAGEAESVIATEEAAAILADEKRKLEETLSLALLIPTQRNIQNYVLESKRQMERSSRFADLWGQTVSQKTSLLKDLSRTHFLLFCFSGTDRLSVQAAETAKEFAKGNGWKLRSISLDGCKMEGLDCEQDANLAKALGMQFAPSFYAVDPMENQITFLGNGEISVMDLEQNVLTQFGNSE